MPGGHWQMVGTLVDRHNTPWTGPVCRLKRVQQNFCLLFLLLPLFLIGLWCRCVAVCVLSRTPSRAIPRVQHRKPPYFLSLTIPSGQSTKPGLYSRRVAVRNDSRVHSESELRAPLGISSKVPRDTTTSPQPHSCQHRLRALSISLPPTHSHHPRCLEPVLFSSFSLLST